MKARKHNENIRNIAIIAHVDHGKTTLVDHMLRQSGTFREGQDVDERVMDSMDLERERGITISAKNCSVVYKNVKINVLDTPGHADFGGEVERALAIVDGAILLVDASEGPLPQTRFVLLKALQLGLKIVVLINKIDRKDARPKEVLEQIYDLFIDLGANDEQIDFPVIYAIGRDGIAKTSLEGTSSDLCPLFDTILSDVPAPAYEESAPLQVLISNLAYSDYLGRLAIGRVANGQINQNDSLVCIRKDGEPLPLKLSQLQVYRGLAFAPVPTAAPGEVVILSGLEEVEIGDTICRKETPKALKRIIVDEPTISMRFSTNTSPFSGKDGKFVQSRKIWERLQKEVLHNVALQIEQTEDADSFVVKGRGEFQMAILIETMRREGFELSVSRPQIIFKKDGERLLEPVEHVCIDCDEQFIGVVTDKISLRKGVMQNLVNHGTGRVRIEFLVPSRGLIGYRSEFLTDTKGTGIMNAYLEGYRDFAGEIVSRKTGSLVSDRDGEAVAYALYHLEPRGRLIVSPGEKLYKGMIVGEHNRENDLNVNACRMKKLSNMRASGRDENIQLTTVTPMTLEKAIEFIAEDELVEITPNHIRLRKTVL